MKQAIFVKVQNHSKIHEKNYQHYQPKCM